MYLIDTSVWIDSLRQVDNPPSRFFTTLISNHTPYGICGVIYQEVLQGARGPQDFEQLRTHLSSLTFWHPLDPVETYAEAANLYRRCRMQGITVRSTLDCLIARLAIEHDLILVHNDRDFGHIKRIEPGLKCAISAVQH